MLVFNAFEKKADMLIRRGKLKFSWADILLGQSNPIQVGHKFSK